MDRTREIVNGSLLQIFNGKNVSLTGVVSHVNGGGLSFDMRTLDDVTVKVIMKRPRGNIQGIVEVHGIANGNSINCDEVIEFSQDNAQEFDVSSHNTLCSLLNTSKNLWEIS